MDNNTWNKKVWKRAIWKSLQSLAFSLIVIGYASYVITTVWNNLVVSMPEVPMLPYRTTVGLVVILALVKGVIFGNSRNTADSSNKQGAKNLSDIFWESVSYITILFIFGSMFASIF